MKKANDILVFVGRFQPFHIGHKHVVDAALEQAEHVIVLVGSAKPIAVYTQSMVIRTACRHAA